VAVLGTGITVQVQDISQRDGIGRLRVQHAAQFRQSPRDVPSQFGLLFVWGGSLRGSGTRVSPS
jgi:hypothetical protein